MRADWLTGLLVTFMALGTAHGNDSKLDECAERGLDWLARHQAAEGGWSCAAFDTVCKGGSCEGGGSVTHDVGVTALALLAFLSSPAAVEVHRNVMDRAIEALVKGQGEDGNFGDSEVPDHTYDHFIATLALVEASTLLERVDLRPGVERGLAYIAAIRNPGTGWRYAEHHPEMALYENDVSATGWAIMTLLAADRADFDVPAEAVADGLLFLEEMSDTSIDAHRARLRAQLDDDKKTVKTIEKALRDADAVEKPKLKRSLEKTKERIKRLKKDVKTGKPDGSVGYFARGSGSARLERSGDRFPAEKSEALTGVVLCCRLDSRKPGKRIDEDNAILLDRCMAWLPSTKDRGAMDGYGWFHCSVALAHPIHKATTARKWRRALNDALEDSQEGGRGCSRGSWDPTRFPWGVIGGRVYQTAILVIAAQAHHGRHGLRTVLQ